jgi:N-acetylmuramic acid 6-phosphate etherase
MTPAHRSVDASVILAVAAACLVAWFVVRVFLRSVRAGMTEAEAAHRAAENRCLSCGYPLRGNTSGACPECGAKRAAQPTEMSLAASADLDVMPTVKALAVMATQDAAAVAAVAAERHNVAAAIELVVAAFQRNGRLIYVGAGTSGRLGVLDASECPPTFRTDPEQVQAIIAGGAAAVVRAVEGAEDDMAAGAAAVDDRGVTPADVVLGIAASGTTPFVLAALRRAGERGARTVLLACVPPTGTEPPVDVQVRPITGPEVLTGSTRLKAGTATKLVLNQITTLAMVRLGKAYGNRMVDVRASNAKLRARATRMVSELTGLDEAAATDLLAQADGHVKVAVVMARRGTTAEAARRLLATVDGRLRDALGG